MIATSNILSSFLDSQLSLESAYERVKHNVDDKTGIIPWVKELPTPYANGTFHISLAKHPILSDFHSLNGLLENLKASSSAIAPSARLAKILSICEALERWTCVSQGGEYSHVFSYNEIRERAFSPKDLHCISDMQYQKREETNVLYPSGGGFIPEPLDPNKQLQWCPVFDVLNNEWKYVLKSSCYFGHHDKGHVYSVADSRGVAAGPDKEFCIWHALLELIETDAGAIWNANRIQRPEVNIESFENPYLLQLKEVHENLGRDLWVLDVTMDIPGVVVLAAISRDRRSGNLIKGFGSHPSAANALKKALMECCQMLPNVINEAHTTIQANEPTPLHFTPRHDTDVLNKDDFSSRLKAKTISDIIHALSAKNIQVLIQDVTRPEIGLHVVRVFGPGMRPWFDRRGPGRLYDVPVNMGIQLKKLQEKEITSKPIES
ncbi:MAG: YcaO-like family protein [Rhodothermales bacterium]